MDDSFQAQQRNFPQLFQRSMAHDSFSWPSIEMLATSSGNAWPKISGKSIQHRANTREAWPWPKQIALSTPDARTR